MVSPREEDNALWINQNAKFALTNIKAAEKIKYGNAFAGNGAYVVVINGSVNICDINLKKRDAVGIWETKNIEIMAEEDSEIIVIEVPMNFRTER